MVSVQLLCQFYVFKSKRVQKSINIDNINCSVRSCIYVQCSDNSIDIACTEKGNVILYNATCNENKSPVIKCRCEKRKGQLFDRTLLCKWYHTCASSLYFTKYVSLLLLGIFLLCYTHELSYVLFYEIQYHVIR